MSDSPRAERTVWCGLACTRLCLPNGDSAVVSDFGAQVLSWEAQGRERLFLSPRAVLDGSTWVAITQGLQAQQQVLGGQVGQLREGSLVGIASSQVTPAALTTSP